MNGVASLPIPELESKAVGLHPLLVPRPRVCLGAFEMMTRGSCAAHRGITEGERSAQAHPSWRGTRGRVSCSHSSRLPALLPGCGKDKSPGPDTTPPAAVTDLALLRTTETSVTVTWTAPGDDGDKGRATSYDLRYSLSALPAAWDSADRRSRACRFPAKPASKRP